VGHFYSATTKNISTAHWYIIAPPFSITSPDTRGELWVGGAQVMQEYLENKEATAKAITLLDGMRYYRTGDIAFMDDRGEYYIVGRIDDTVKVAGQRVNLSDVDAYVGKLEYIENCGTIAIEDSDRGAILVLYASLNYSKGKKEILNDLDKVLVRHQLPQDIIILDNLPVNNSGKICKKSLQQLYLKKQYL
jgi:D-alanine--poly(phosphoribitol) ligase subunit 1